MFNFFIFGVKLMWNDENVKLNNRVPLENALKTLFLWLNIKLS